MNDFIILAGTGFIIFVLGVLLLKNEKRKFSDAITTDAKVVSYYDYRDIDGEVPITMYTMVIEYQDQSGNKIQAKEQSSSSVKKYPVGTSISISYSREKPDFFVLAGDRTRFYIFYGMMIVGLLMMFGIAWVLFQS